MYVIINFTCFLCFYWKHFKRWLGAGNRF